MKFTETEAQFRQLKAQYDAGDLSETDFKARLQDLMIQDEQGRWWMIGYETGQWYVHDGEKWVLAELPTSYRGAAAAGQGRSGGANSTNHTPREACSHGDRAGTMDAASTSAVFTVTAADRRRHPRRSSRHRGDRMACQSGSPADASTGRTCDGCAGSASSTSQPHAYDSNPKHDSHRIRFASTGCIARDGTSH